MTKLSAMARHLLTYIGVSGLKSMAGMNLTIG